MNDSPDEHRWIEKNEKADGSGYKLYSRSFWRNSDSMFFTFCYAPSRDHAWFYTEISDDSTTRFKCESWDEANKLFEQLFYGENSDSD